MKVVIFGLTLSSSWGNGHATIWRGLCSALCRLGHQVVFLEKDVPYYAAARDFRELPEGGKLIFYSTLSEVVIRARRELADADLAMTTSYCPDALAATELILDSQAEVKAFYDLDAPVTLDRLARGDAVEYIPDRGLRDFDLVLSYTGGHALTELRNVLGASKWLLSLEASIRRRTFPCPAGRSTARTYRISAPTRRTAKTGSRSCLSNLHASTAGEDL